jgi:ATP synthase protein I
LTTVVDGCHMAYEKNSRQSTMQQLGPYMGLGIQLAAAMVAFGALGWWLDTKFATTPWLLIIGIVMGATGGMIHLIRTAVRSNPRADTDPPKDA